MFAAKEDETASREGADLQTPQPDSHTLTSSVEAVAKSGSTASIYLDDGLSEDPQPSKTPQPPRRLTMVRPSFLTCRILSSYIIRGFSPVPWLSCDLSRRLTIVMEITEGTLPSLVLLSHFPFLSLFPSFCFSFTSSLFHSLPSHHSQAQRAAMEALASFGGTDLSSMQVKKRDLKTELKRDAEKLREEEKEEGEDKQVETRKTR